MINPICLIPEFFPFVDGNVFGEIAVVNEVAELQSFLGVGVEPLLVEKAVDQVGGGLPTGGVVDQVDELVVLRLFLMKILRCLGVTRRVRFSRFSPFILLPTRSAS